MTTGTFPARKIMMAEWSVLEIPEGSPTAIRQIPNVVLRILAA